MLYLENARQKAAGKERGLRGSPVGRQNVAKNVESLMESGDFRSGNADAPVRIPPKARQLAHSQLAASHKGTAFSGPAEE